MSGVNEDRMKGQRLCRLMEVSYSGYKKFVRRDRKDLIKKNELKREIKKIFKESNNTYGSPRIYAALKHRGFQVSKATVERLMREMGLKSQTRRKYRVSTTNSKHRYKTVSNKLNRNFKATRLNEKWTADITYIPTREGWCYLAVVEDLYSRRIIGWCFSDSLSYEIVLKALQMAIMTRGSVLGTLFHSDRGVQYACDCFKNFLKRNKIDQSMSRTRNPWDNAPMESFFHTFKVEFVYHQNFETIEEARIKCFEWIESYYNRYRLHSSLGYRTPVDVEEEFMLKKVA